MNGLGIRRPWAALVAIAARWSRSPLSRPVVVPAGPRPAPARWTAPTPVPVVGLEGSGLPGDDDRPLVAIVDDYLACVEQGRRARASGASAGRVGAMEGRAVLAADEILARVGPDVALVRSGICLLTYGGSADRPGLMSCPTVLDLDKEAAAAWEAAVLAAAGDACAGRDPGPEGRAALIEALAIIGECSDIRAAAAIRDLAGREPPGDMLAIRDLAVELVARARRRRGDEHVAALIDALEDGRSPFSRLDPPESTGPPGPDLGPHTPTPEDDEGID